LYTITNHLYLEVLQQPIESTSADSRDRRYTYEIWFEWASWASADD